MNNDAAAILAAAFLCDKKVFKSEKFHMVMLKGESTRKEVGFVEL